MAKKRVAPDRKKALKKIDNIPKCSQQPRSSPPKRRTDFSSFFCKSISLFNSDSLLLEKNAEGKELFPSSIVRCSKSQEEGSGFSSNSTEASFLEVELVGQDALLESSDSREVGKDGSDASPVSVAWAKSHKMWWSAEDMLQKEHHILSSELIKRSAASNHSDEQDFSSDKSTLSSNRAEDDIIERGRGKRERKPKLHFDDITCPLNPERKVRRLRIMRYLGLTPPVGSPF
ncbi:uncharacterized protein LOC133831206 isoform X2 [Humulus lupulus]|uniref:uncharacterized protein LOC133831206 isoform X2 n=1 Tax=Humulus lupulus TaxID=3486 RepID=UPI002B4072BC|nr:uncharacterized protein LOC133831206 isoform X2 [Humulus lupulus]